MNYPRIWIAKCTLFFFCCCYVVEKRNEKKRQIRTEEQKSWWKTTTPICLFFHSPQSIKHFLYHFNVQKKMACNYWSAKMTIHGFTMAFKKHFINQTPLLLFFLLFIFLVSFISFFISLAFILDQKFRTNLSLQ